MYMDFFYENYEEENDENNSNSNIFSYLKRKKKLIIKVAIFLVVVIFLLIIFSPSNRYRRIENKMVSAAKDYVKDNYVSISGEVYLDVGKINYDLTDSCSKASGVFFDGSDFIPYLYCNNYKSNVIKNVEDTVSLNGDEVIILSKGIFFTDPGYSSEYNIDIMGEVGTEEGVYSLQYHDLDNNNVITRKVVILDNNELLDNYPSISLNGRDIVHIFKGDNYYEEGVIATDKKEGNITDNVIVSGKVNINEIGSYKIVYSITNKDGLTNSVSRMVNVVNKNLNMNIDYLISPTTIVNTSVNISIKITGSDFDYALLPNGKKEYQSYFNYEIEKNGTYIFSIYDKAERVIKKEIKITNIDKDLPVATCDAVIYNNYTNIYVNSLSSKKISSYEYQINNQLTLKQISTTYHYDSPNITSASVIINDTIGNKNTIKCDIQKYNNWKTDQLMNFFKTYFILKKAEVFSRGGYSINLKQLIFKLNNANYCDVYNGCKLVNKNGSTFYLSNDIDYAIDSVFSTKEKLSDNIINIMNSAYEETKKEIIVSNNYNNVLTKYTELFSIDDTIREYILKEIGNNRNYLDIIKTYFNGYKIYNIDEYADKYTDSKTLYWWPIGSSYAVNGIFSGAPEYKEIVHNYGASINDNKVYDYLAIRGECNKTNVISSWNGIVVSVSYSSEYGNYVTIDYGNGVKFTYGALNKNSIMVKVGDSVRKGQLIGKIDRINNSCMLYLKTTLNDIGIDPMEYVSVSDTRPAGGENIVYVPGSTVKESVCSTLVASGFSTNAVAGIMANIERESGFRLQSLGDAGTSYGLCQWNNSRWERLINHCGNRIDTVDCQLDYLLYELKNYYKDVYAYIMDNNTAYDIGYYFCYHFEKPAKRDTTSCTPRGDNAQNVYVNYVNNGCR